jgi:thiol-disulfide isomerase/thioredoxin
MTEIAAEEKKRVDDIKARQVNLEFLKTATGEDTLLVRTKGDKPTVAKLLQSIGDDGVVGLYFSAHWCPPCRRFTPMLVEAYGKLKADGKKFEVVFISSDREKQGFEDYFNSMVTSSGDQLMALDFEDRERKKDLGKVFNVQGIPTLILLKPTGELITQDGTEALTYGHQYFPWDKAAMERGAEEAKAKAAALAQAAAEKEKEDAAAQRQAGDVVVLRLSGAPVEVEHDVAAKTVKFKSFCTVGAPEALATCGVVYYEFEVLINEGGIPQIGTQFT